MARRQGRWSQADRLLDVLKRDGSLCAMEPLRWEPPITRVAARIHGLRGRGYLIRTDNCDRHSSESGSSRHASYRFLGAVNL